MSASVPLAKLCDVAELNPRLTASLNDGDAVSFLPMAAIDSELTTAVDREIRSYAEVRKGYAPFLNGDVLIAKITPCFENGKIAQANLSHQYGFGSTEFHVVRPHADQVDARYLVHYLRQEGIRRQGESRMTGSAGQRRIPEHFLAGLNIPLPPVPEQRRIAAILDKADALRAKRCAAIAQLDALAQSIFLDMFGDPASNPRKWPVHNFGELFVISSSKRVLESQWQKTGVPFYRAREIVKLAKDGHVNNELFISEELFSELSKDGGAPAAGDLMISAVGTLGACYQVRGNERFYFKDASVLRFAPMGRIEPSFVRHAFGTDHVQQQVHRGSGSTVGTYTIARARQTSIFVPPISLQRRFCQVISCVQRQSAAQVAMLSEIKCLFASLQHRAFHSEL